MRRILITCAACGAFAVVPSGASAQSADAGYEQVPNVPPVVVTTPPPTVTPPPTTTPVPAVTPPTTTTPVPAVTAPEQEDEVVPEAEVAPERSAGTVPAAQAAPAPKRVFAAQQQEESLPVTGRDLGLISVVGVLLVAAGIALHSRTGTREGS